MTMYALFVERKELKTNNISDIVNHKNRLYLLFDSSEVLMFYSVDVDVMS